MAALRSGQGSGMTPLVALSLLVFEGIFGIAWRGASRQPID